MKLIRDELYEEQRHYRVDLIVDTIAYFTAHNLVALPITNLVWQQVGALIHTTGFDETY